jgi:segregation and condensation protein A
VETAERTVVKVTLENFQGPLDLLLHLIREAKLDIKTVHLADVTAQYLEFMNQIGRASCRERVWS